jgi:hypothetical protein
MTTPEYLTIRPIQPSRLEPNTITLQTSDTSEPILVLKPNGDIYVNGRLTTNDMEVVEGLRRFLEQAEYIYQNK